METLVKPSFGSMPKIGSSEFWEFYDDFCLPENLEKFINTPEINDEPSGKMHLIMHAAHMTREIHRLKREEKGWKCHHAYLALKSVQLRTICGEHFFTTICRGEVVTIQHQWNRDVPITHFPINTNIQCGYFTDGAFPEKVGLFLPLFDKKTIMTCIELRLKKNMKDAIVMAEKESRDWGWYA